MTALAPSSRRLWRKVAIGFAVGFVLLAANFPPWGLHRERESFTCATCFSRKSVFQWKIGPWGTGSLPVSPQSIIIKESNTLRTFAPQPHIHQWQFSQGSPYYMFGTMRGGCALGGGGRNVNDLAGIGEYSWPEFSAFLENKLKSGKLTTNQIYEALISPRIQASSTIPPTSGQAMAQLLADEFFDQPIPSH